MPGELGRNLGRLRDTIVEDRSREVTQLMPSIDGHASHGRRRFVKTAAAAVATAQFPILGANDRINLAVVGLGGRGSGHVNYYSTLNSECRLAAICDVNQAARERGTAQVRKLND